jgi:hypothetical protein
MRPLRECLWHSNRRAWSALLLGFRDPFGGPCLCSADHGIRGPGRKGRRAICGAARAATTQGEHHPMFSIEIHPQQGFAQVPQAIARDPDLKPMDKALWALLKSYARADGFTTVGHEALARDLGVKSASVKRSLSQLRKAGHVLQEDQGRDLAGKHLPIRKWLLTDVVDGKVIRRAPEPSGHKSGGSPVTPGGQPGIISDPRSVSPEEHKSRSDGGSPMHPGQNGGSPVTPYIDAPLGASVDTEAETPSGSHGLGQEHQEGSAFLIHQAPAPAEGGDQIHASGPQAAIGRRPGQCMKCARPSQWWANGHCAEHAGG